MLTGGPFWILKSPWPFRASGAAEAPKGEGVEPQATYGLVDKTRVDDVQVAESSRIRIYDFFQCSTVEESV